MNTTCRRRRCPPTAIIITGSGLGWRTAPQPVRCTRLIPRIRRRPAIEHVTGRDLTHLFTVNSTNAIGHHRENQTFTCWRYSHLALKKLFSFILLRTYVSYCNNTIVNFFPIFLFTKLPYKQGRSKVRANRPVAQDASFVGAPLIHNLFFKFF